MENSLAQSFEYTEMVDEEHNTIRNSMDSGVKFIIFGGTFRFKISCGFARRLIAHHKDKKQSSDVNNIDDYVSVSGVITPNVNVDGKIMYTMTTIDEFEQLISIEGVDGVDVDVDGVKFLYGEDSNLILEQHPQHGSGCPSCGRKMCFHRRIIKNDIMRIIGSNVLDVLNVDDGQIGYDHVYHYYDVLSSISYITHNAFGIKYEGDQQFITAIIAFVNSLSVFNQNRGTFKMSSSIKTLLSAITLVLGADKKANIVSEMKKLSKGEETTNTKLLIVGAVIEYSKTASRINKGEREKIVQKQITSTLAKYFGNLKRPGDIIDS